jgi:hypothetical protein
VLQPAAQIVCIDCGGRAFLLTPAREDDVWEAGDIVAYRCADCLDRWDLVLDDDPDTGDDPDRWAR